MRNGQSTFSETRERLLDAAARVFAARGFHQATVREICDLAKANIAAVNYHFQTKERLYAAVLQHTHHSAIEKYPPQMGLTGRDTPRDRLRAFVRALLFRIFDAGPAACFG